MEGLSLLLVADSVGIWGNVQLCASLDKVLPPLCLFVEKWNQPLTELCSQMTRDWSSMQMFSIFDIVIHIYSQILVLGSLCVVCLGLRILPGI